MNKQKGFSTNLAIIIILLIIGVGVYVYKENTNKYCFPYCKNMTDNDREEIKNSIPENISEDKIKEEVKKVNPKVDKDLIVGTCGLSISSHKPNDVVDWPITISGKVSNQKSSEDCMWQTFENVSGNARLYIYEDKVWRPVGQSLIFNPSFSLNFNYKEIGLPMNSPIKIVFTEENSSAKRPSLIFELPLVLK